jgi:uncharacterized protein (DUF1778 family)
MSRSCGDDDRRMNLRISPEVKAKLFRAAAIRDTDLTSFVTQIALREAEAVIQADEVRRLTEQDRTHILELLEQPPRPNAKLRSVIAALPEFL